MPPLKRKIISYGRPSHCATGGGAALQLVDPGGGIQVVSKSNSHTSVDGAVVVGGGSVGKVVSEAVGSTSCVVVGEAVREAVGCITCGVDWRNDGAALTVSPLGILLGALVGLTSVTLL